MDSDTQIVYITSTEHPSETWYMNISKDRNVSCGLDVEKLDPDHKLLYNDGKTKLRFDAYNDPSFWIEIDVDVWSVDKDERRQAIRPEAME